MYANTEHICKSAKYFAYHSQGSLWKSERVCCAQQVAADSAVSTESEPGLSEKKEKKGRARRRKTCERLPRLTVLEVSRLKVFNRSGVGVSRLKGVLNVPCRCQPPEGLFTVYCAEVGSPTMTVYCVRCTVAEGIHLEKGHL